jgi:hypothetical protein
LFLFFSKVQREEEEVDRFAQEEGYFLKVRARKAYWERKLAEESAQKDAEFQRKLQMLATKSELPGSK